MINILGDQNTGVVLSNLPNANEITLNDFNSISGFVVGQPKSAFPVDTDLTQYLKTDTTSGKLVKGIADLIKQGDLKIKVSQGAFRNRKFFSRRFYKNQNFNWWSYIHNWIYFSYCLIINILKDCNLQSFFIFII